MGDVDAPRDGPLDLGAALAQHLGGVGVLPQVVDVAGEAALARQQGGGVGDGAEAVGLVLAVEREVHADVVGGQGRMAAWRAHGAGTIRLAQVATPWRMASNTPSLAAWQLPRSSQEMMTSRVSAA